MNITKEAVLEINHIFGLPAHPLLVHAAVVLVPLAAIAFVAVGWKEAWRKAYYFPVTVLAVSGAVFAFLAKQSGEPLTSTVRQAGHRVGEHPEQGDTAFFFAMLLGLAVFSVFVYHRYGTRILEAVGIKELPRLPLSYDTILYAVTVPLAALAVLTMVIAGHSGAELVWKTNVN